MIRRTKRDIYTATEHSGNPDFVQVHLGPIRVGDLPAVLSNFDPEQFIRQNLSKTIQTQKTRIEKSNIPGSDPNDFRNFEASNSIPESFHEEKIVAKDASASEQKAAPLSQFIESLEGGVSSAAGFVASSVLLLAVAVVALAL